jgi:hypothetical protein
MSLLPAGFGFGQTTDTKNESRPGAGDDALVPLAGGPPLTAREEEMLRLIKGLQDRVALLEARGGSDGGDAQPAAQESSQARLLVASIVSLPAAGVKAAGAATLAVPTFHTIQRKLQLYSGGHTSSASTATRMTRVSGQTGSRIRTKSCAGIRRRCICSGRLWVTHRYRLRWAARV